MNRTSRFFFLVAGVSALIAGALGVWLLATVNAPQPSDTFNSSAAAQSPALPITPKPTPLLDQRSDTPSFTIDSSPPKASPSPTPSPVVSHSPEKSPPTAKGEKDEEIAEKTASEILSQSLQVHPGDKFEVLNSKITKQDDGKVWLVNLKAYYAHAPVNGVPNLQQEIVVERITLADSAGHRFKEQRKEELLRFIVCQLHLTASRTGHSSSPTNSPSNIGAQEIVERIRRELLSPPGPQLYESSPYFREQAKLNELNDKHINLIVEDAKGKVVSSSDECFQALGSSDAKVLIAWSMAKNLPRCLIVKRLD